MMKKRLFIAIHYLEIGGAEMSLIGLLQALDYTRYAVDLFVYGHRGELMQFIPKEVNLLPEIPAYAAIEKPMTQCLRQGQWGVLFGRLKARMQYCAYCRRTHPKDGAAILQYIFNAVEPFLPSLHRLGTYDLAISFLTPHNIVLHKVSARRKAAWIHTDYTHIDVNAPLELPVWSGFDHIVSISPSVRASFLKVFPSLESRIVEIENILSPAFVRRRAAMIPREAVEREMPRRPGTVNILSVGRFSDAKNYDNVPDICRRIIALGQPVVWYIIGYGGDEALVRRKIAEAGMERQVVLLGKRANPYPYIQACDIYAQPSRYEGKSVTVREAQMLCKPVVVTDYATARSQVSDGVDGCIVPMDNAGCAGGIFDFVKNQPLQSRITDYLATHDYGNEQEARKVERLAE